MTSPNSKNNGLINNPNPPTPMYKPTPKSIEELEARKSELTQQIINGAKLSAPAMDKLTKSLADVKKQLKERQEEVKNG